MIMLPVEILNNLCQGLPSFPSNPWFFGESEYCMQGFRRTYNLLQYHILVEIDAIKGYVEQEPTSTATCLSGVRHLAWEAQTWSRSKVLHVPTR